MGKVADFRPVIGAALLATVFALVWAATAFEEVLAAGAIWPANALVLAFVLRACPGALTTRLTVAAAAATMAVAYLAAGTRPWLALALPLAHALEILLAVHLLGPRRAAYSTFSDLRRLVVGAVLAAPLASALASLPLLMLAGAVEGSPARAAAGWFGAHAFGMAVVAPFALYAAARGAWARRGSGPPRLTRVLEEALAAAIAAAPRGGRVRIGVEGLTDGVRVRVEDDDAGGVAARLTAHQLAKLERAPLHGRAVDRNWLRQHGGDLTVAVGALGGLRVDLLLPAAGQRAAA